MTCLLLDSDWLLTPQRVAIHVPTQTAVVADLHLGYDLVRRHGGDAVPTVTMADELATLRQVLSEHALRRLIVAGDLVESARCGDLVPAFRNWLSDNGVEWSALAPGNHDQGLEWPAPQAVTLGEWTIAHGDRRPPTGRVIQGHIHPCLRLSKSVSAPCYLVRQNHIVLPAYSSDAAGVNVFNGRRWRDYRCCVIAGSKVVDVGMIGSQVSRLKQRPHTPLDVTP